MSAFSNGRRLAIAAAASAVLAGMGSAKAAPFTWSSSTGGDWSNSANWGGNAVVSAADTSVDFSTVSGTYTATNNIGTTTTSPFVLNRLVLGGSGVQTIAGGYLQFAGTNPKIERIAGLTTAPAISSILMLGSGVELTIAGSGSLQLNISSNGAVTGQGSLRSTGGTLVMIAGNSSYSGGTTLDAGELVIFADSTGSVGTLTKGPVGTGTLTLNGGTIRTNSTNARTLYNQTTIGGNVTFGSSVGNNMTFAAPALLSGSGAIRTITLGGGKTTSFTGAIGDGGGGNGITVAGSGVLTLGGGAADTSANTYTGLTTLNSSTATLMLDKADGTNAIAGNLHYQSGTLSWARANQIADTSNVTVAGSTLTFTADETVNNVTVTGGSFKGNPGVNVNVASLNVTGGSAHAHGGTLTVGAGGLQISRPEAGSVIFDALQMNNGGAGTLKLAGDVTVAASSNDNGTRIKQGGAGGYLDLNGAQRTFNIADGAAPEDLAVTLVIRDNVGSGGGFRKTGAGTLALPNAAEASVTGDSVIEAGRLVVYNQGLDPTVGSATGSGNLTVNAGATLGGNGRIGGIVNVFGTVDPSIPSRLDLGGTYSTIQTLVLASAEFENGSLLRIDGVGSSSTDLLYINGTLDLDNSGDTIDLYGSVDGAAEYIVAHAGTIIGSFDTVNLGGLTGDTSGYSLISRQADSGGYDLVLAVPEPSTAMTALLAAGLMGLRRRQK